MEPCYYSERLHTARLQLATVRDAMEALDTERLERAAATLGNSELRALAAAVERCAAVRQAQSVLEELREQHCQRIGHLLPLARREEQALHVAREAELRRSV